jgi:hypothetical protein
VLELEFLACFKELGFMFLAKAPGLPWPNNAGYLVKQAHREKEGLFIVAILVEHDTGDCCHLLGDPGVAIDLDGEVLATMRVNGPEPAGDSLHPRSISIYGRLVETDPVSLAEAFSQIYARGDHYASLLGRVFSLTVRASWAALTIACRAVSGS